MLREAKLLDLTPSKGEAASPRGHCCGGSGLAGAHPQQLVLDDQPAPFIRQADREPTLADPPRLPFASGQFPYPQLLAVISLLIIF